MLGDRTVRSFGDNFIRSRVNDHCANRRFSRGGRLGGKLDSTRHVAHVAGAPLLAMVQPRLQLSFQRHDGNPMRIIGGEFKGRRISAPDGMNTRPTTDRTREAVFNLLTHAEWAPPLHDKRVIDAFAGSGSLGFEALSRGASFCLFVETASPARGTIRTNIDTLGLFGRTRIHRRSATDLGTKPASVGPRFDIAFLDPPYGYELAPNALAALVDGDWLADDAIAVVETSKDEAPTDYPGWTTLDSREYGPARIAILARSRPTS